MPREENTEYWPSSRTSSAKSLSGNSLIFESYNVEQLTALVRAAEAKRSPLLILLFPSIVSQLPTLPFAAAAAVRSATVPLALHLDHAQDADQIRTIAESMPFDSIMVDMSHYEQAKNLSMTKELAAVCHARGVAVEGESGRINGGEEGIADTGDLKGLICNGNTINRPGLLTCLLSYAHQRIQCRGFPRCGC
jgi:fructose/tagatose bisphosphate aldolase